MRRRRFGRSLRRRYGPAKPVYTVSAGRLILREGEPFIGIQRSGSTDPGTADAITHVIAACLNGKKA